MAELNTRQGSAADPPTEPESSDAAASTSGPAEAASTPAEAASTPAEETSIGGTEVDAGKPESTHAAEPKPTEPKPTESVAAATPVAAEPSKPTGAKPADARSTDTEPTDTEPTDAKPVEVEPGKVKADAAEPGTTSVSSTPPTPKKVEKNRARPSVLVLALSALLVALLLGAGLLGWHRYQAGRIADDRSQALQTARDVASNLTTITSDNFNGQIDALSKISTSTFKDQMTGYSAMFGALLKQGNVSLRGTITSAGLETVDRDKGTASALVTVSTLITSGQQPQGVPQSFGLSVALQRDGDRWLASNVEFLR